MVLPVGLWLCKQRPLTVTQSLLVVPEAQGDGRGRAGGEVEATGLLGRFGWELDGEGGIKDPPPGSDLHTWAWVDHHGHHG